MKKLLLLISLVFLLISCKDSNVAPKAIVGKWRWDVSSGGVGVFVIKPKSDETVFFQFLSNNDFKIVKNDTLIGSGNFRIITIKSIYTGNNASGIYLDNTVLKNTTQPLPFLITDKFVINVV